MFVLNISSNEYKTYEIIKEIKLQQALKHNIDKKTSL
jgi:hypothetical protein